MEEASAVAVSEAAEALEEEDKKSKVESQKSKV